MPTPHPVKTALTVRGETQLDLARALGRSPNALYPVLNGQRRAWPKLRREIADYLELPEAELFPEFEVAP
jgi:transcriptional regulator with XRE-family HTH domain